MLLFFDTETTGLPRHHRAPVSDLDNWPRLVQIAWLLSDAHGDLQQGVEAIIRPDGFSIPVDAARVHGITTERAMAEGQPLQKVLQQFLNALEQADTLVGHNIAFDENVLGAELLRCGFSNPLPYRKHYCTMEASTTLCQLPGPRGYKWPRLDELHRFLFGQEVAFAHNARADMEATVRCFFELQRRGLIV